jgi:AraC-like DNA-binding protein
MSQNWLSLVGADAIAETLEERSSGTHYEIERSDGKPCAMQARFRNIDGVGIAALSGNYAVHATSRIDSSALTLTFVTKGPMAISPGVGRHDIDAGEGDCLVIPFKEGTLARIAPEGTKLVVDVPDSVVRDILSRHFHIDPPRRIDWHPIVRRDQSNLHLLQRLIVNAHDTLEAIEADDITSNQAILAGQYRDLIVSSLLLTLPNSLTDALSKNNDRLTPRAMRRALEFMRANLAESITIDMIASAAGCSPRALHYAFREQYQTTPMNQLKQLRLEAAEGLLRSGSYANLTDVALSVGFRNPGRFSGAFRRRFGYLPSQFQRTI